MTSGRSARVTTRRRLPTSEAALSVDRLSSYLAAANGDPRHALALYEWNTRVSAAFYVPLQAVEVGLRNACHRELSVLFGTTWPDEPGFLGLDRGFPEQIRGAKERLRRLAQTADTPHIVAELPFGFWTTLLSRRLEHSLWSQGLRRAFPRVQRISRISPARSVVADRFDYLRTFRNRIAHQPQPRNRGKEEGAAPGRAAPGTADGDARRFAGGARDRALILLGYAGAFRRSELVALDVEQLRFSKQGLYVWIAAAKNDPRKKGRELYVPRLPTVSQSAALCAIAALERWLAVVGAVGPVFRTFDLRGRLTETRLDPGDVARILRRRAAAAGVAGDFAGHSLRRGFITNAAKKKYKKALCTKPAFCYSKLVRLGCASIVWYDTRPG